MNRVAVGGLAFALIGSAAAAAEGPDLGRAASLVKKGERAFEKGRLDDAAASYRKALAAAPGYPYAHIGLGHIATREQRFQDAYDEYSEALAGYETLGDALQAAEMKRYNDAQREIRRLEDEIRNINSAQTKVSEGTRSTSTLQLEQAIQRLRAMPYPDPEARVEPPADLYFHIGNASYHLRRNDEALAAWETCRDKNPEFAPVYNNLAAMYLMRNELARARASLARAEELGVKVNPDMKRDIEARTRQAGEPAAESPDGEPR